MIRVATKVERRTPEVTRLKPVLMAPPEEEVPLWTLWPLALSAASARAPTFTYPSDLSASPQALLPSRNPSAARARWWHDQGEGRARPQVVVVVLWQSPPTEGGPVIEGGEAGPA